MSTSVLPPATTRPDLDAKLYRVAVCLAAQRRASPDPIAATLARAFAESERREVDIVVLHGAYKDRCDHANTQPLTIDMFAREIANRGCGLIERGGYVLASRAAI